MQQSSLPQRLALPSVRFDFLSVGILLAFLLGWHWRVAGYLSPIAGLSLAFLLALCLVYGKLVTRLIAPIFPNLPGMPFQILMGYFVFNSLLFIVVLCSPFGMAIDLIILAAIALAGLFILRRRRLPPEESASTDHLAGCIAVFLSCLGATICCNDIQVPDVQNGNVIYKVWSDMFIHVREISVFAQAHGIGSIQDIKLAGGRAPIYHFASYISPAAMSVLSGATAMQVYASLQLPLGIALTGLAAYCFMGKLFGWGPGLAATVGVVLIPDAYQQGFQLRYLSYNFMAQVNLGMLYGIAAVAMAWMFMIDGCRRGKIGPILLAYGFLVVCLFYKAHLFVANSFVLMVFPFVFFTPVRRRWRAGLGVLAIAVFCAVIAWSQSNPRVPTLRLDGSGIGDYVVLLIHVSDGSWISEAMHRILIEEHHGRALQAAVIALFLLVSTFGLWMAGVLAALGKSWRTMPVLFWSFPIIVMGNYLVTSMGLAADKHMVGSAEELLNRPLVWAYFVVAAWTSAVGYRLLIGAELARGRAAVGAVLACMLCVGAALWRSPGLQTYPQFAVPTFATGAVPNCLVDAADYLRHHSDQHDIIQDAEADTRFRLSAMAERQLYVGNEFFGGVSAAQKARLAELESLKLLRAPDQIQQFFSERHIAWYLQRPETKLLWPQAGLPAPVMQCGGFRLFHFNQALAQR